MCTLDDWIFTVFHLIKLSCNSVAVFLGCRHCDTAILESRASARYLWTDPYTTDSVLYCHWSLLTSCAFNVHTECCCLLGLCCGPPPPVYFVLLYGSCLHICQLRYSPGLPTYITGLHFYQYWRTRGDAEKASGRLHASHSHMPLLQLMTPKAHKPPFKFATVPHGSTETNLMNNFPKMYEYMRQYNRSTVQKGIKAVKDG